VNDNYLDPLSADDYSISDFGVDQEGEFVAGSPVGWVVTRNRIDYRLPRFCVDQPVLFLADDVNKSVYLRGLYSERLSRKRRASARGYEEAQG